MSDLTARQIEQQARDRAARAILAHQQSRATAHHDVLTTEDDATPAPERHKRARRIPPRIRLTNPQPIRLREAAQLAAAQPAAFARLLKAIPEESLANPVEIAALILLDIHRISEQRRHANRRQDAA